MGCCRRGESRPGRLAARVGSPTLSMTPDEARSSSFLEFLRLQVRLLTFRSCPIEPARVGALTCYALGFTWLAGVGRYWDHPDAYLWQYLGLGSVAYVFVMGWFIWLVCEPLKPRAWSYRSVVLFVAMTSPPAILYAIPVERFMDLQTASATNVWFLAIVAAWRVGLLLRHLLVVARLDWWEVLICALLPLAAIVTLLTLLNLEHAVFELMGGIAEGTANDAAYVILILLTYLSMFALVPLLVGYGLIVGYRMRRPRIEEHGP